MYDHNTLNLFYVGRKKGKELNSYIYHKNMLIFLINSVVKVNISPLYAMKAHGGCGCKSPHIDSHGTRER